MKLFKNFFHSQLWVPVCLLGLGVLAYGYFIPWLGFYWDDMPFQFIYQRFGSQGIQDYFATKRPVLAYMYQVLMPVLGRQPWVWHIFGLLARWLASLALYGLIKKLWPAKPNLAFLTAVLFMIYPGFDQQAIPIAYSPYFLTLAGFLASLSLTVQTISSPSKNNKYKIALAVLLSLTNLLTTEYFFVLELSRILLILFCLRQTRQPLKHWFRYALPYLAAFLAVAAWRVFFFRFQTYSYSPQVIAQLRQEPLAGVLNLLRTIVLDVWLVAVKAWSQAWAQLTQNPLSTGNLVRLGLFIVLAVVMIWLSLLFTIKPQQGKEKPTTVDFFAPLILAFFWLVLAGWPYWLTDLPVALGFPNSRFTLSFLPGVALFAASLLQFFSAKKWLQLPLVVLLLTSALSFHYQNGLAYRQDSDNLARIFEQLHWRIPALQPNTTLASNYHPPTHYSDNSLTAPLNLVYAENPGSLDYLWVYPEVRLGASFSEPKPNLPIFNNYLVAEFNGSTSQMVVISHHPRFCVRVLDPDLDPHNPLLSTEMQQMAALSSTAPIRPGSSQLENMPNPLISGSPSTDWCKAFEKADLARQQKDWQQAAAFLDAALQAGEAPKTPTEWWLPIEVYAQAENWEKARDYTSLALKPLDPDQPDLAPVLCRLWQRILAETPASPERQASWEQVSSEANCR